MFTSRRVTLLLSVAACAAALCHGFTIAPALVARRSSSLSFSSGGDAEPIRVKQVRKAIDGLNSDNFYQTLQTIEPFLLNGAGTTAYAKCMHRIKRSAKVLKIDLPANYAVQAVATTKRREKQNAFIQTKEEARVAAEAKAIEEAEAAKAAAAEAEAKAAAEAEEAARAAAEAAAAPEVAPEADAAPVEVTDEAITA